MISRCQGGVPIGVINLDNDSDSQEFVGATPRGCPSSVSAGTVAGPYIGVSLNSLRLPQSILKAAMNIAYDEFLAGRNRVSTQLIL
jgi:hypothetical protein